MLFSIVPFFAFSHTLLYEINDYKKKIDSSVIAFFLQYKVPSRVMICLIPFLNENQKKIQMIKQAPFILLQLETEKALKKGITGNCNFFFFATMLNQD